jgi:hypothetical protein
VVHGRRALGGGYMGGCHTEWIMDIGGEHLEGIMDIGGGHVGYAKISKNQKYKKNYLKVCLVGQFNIDFVQSLEVLQKAITVYQLLVVNWEFSLNDEEI